MAVRFGFDAALPAFLYLAAVGVALWMIDLDVKRLPNAIVLPSYGVAGALLTVAAVASGEWGDLLRSLLGMAALFGLYFLLALVYPAGMGFGDVKLAGVLGLYLGWLGWAEVVTGGFLGFLLGGVVGLGADGGPSRRSQVPDPLRAVHARRGDDRDPVGRCFGRPLPRQRARLNGSLKAAAESADPSS